LETHCEFCAPNRHAKFQIGQCKLAAGELALPYCDNDNC
jgi:hypothetical protein